MCCHELNYTVQTLKTCKAYHKRAAAGKEDNRFRDPPGFVERGRLETDNTGGPRAIADRRHVVSVSALNYPKPPVYHDWYVKCPQASRSKEEWILRFPPIRMNR